MSRAQNQALHEPFRKPRQSVRACDHPGCAEEGAYPAPRGRESLREYYYFCLEHVRAYNRSWDYYRDMSEEEIERENRRDQTWHRPSWPLGGNLNSALHRAQARHKMRDPFGFFAEDEAAAEKDRQRRQQEAEAEDRRRAHQRNAWDEYDGQEAGRRRSRMNRAESEEARALATLDLDPPVTFEAIKTRYKSLVKRLHPDVNGGDRSTEDRLKEVNQAYATLRNAYARYTGT